MGDKVRVLRILEYVGDRDWIEKTLSNPNSYVPLNGIKLIGDSGNCIKSAIIDQFPEILERIIIKTDEIKSDNEEICPQGGLHNWDSFEFSEELKGKYCTKCNKRMIL